MKYPILLALLMAATAATAAHAQEYVFKDQPFESGSLSTDGKNFSISTVGYSGNLCDLGGRLKNTASDRPPSGHFPKPKIQNTQFRETI